MMLSCLLLLWRRIPPLLEPDPLRRILADDPLDDGGHLHGKLMEIAVTIARIRAAHDLPNNDFMLSIRLPQDECGHDGGSEFAGKDRRSERGRCRASEKLDEGTAGAAVLIGKKAEQFAALQRTRRRDQLTRSA